MSFFYEISILIRLFFLGLYYLFEMLTTNFLIPAFLSKKVIHNDVVLVTGAGTYFLNMYI
jgi:hypothetical protein